MGPFTTGILLDQGLPRSAVDLLRARGADCAHVAELGMSAAADTEVLAEADRRRWTVVTLDADYHKLLALSRADRPSAILLRIHGLRAGPLAEVLARVFEHAGQELELGAVATVTPARIRVRRLPLRA
jgi:predicted nuclease of predicted toxin-antitoxin system